MGGCLGGLYYLFYSEIEGVVVGPHGDAMCLEGLCPFEPGDVLLRYVEWQTRVRLFLGNLFKDAVELLHRLPRHQIENMAFLIVGQFSNFVLVDAANANGRYLHEK